MYLVSLDIVKFDSTAYKQRPELPKLSLSRALFLFQAFAQGNWHSPSRSLVPSQLKMPDDEIFGRKPPQSSNGHTLGESQRERPGV